MWPNQPADMIDTTTKDYLDSNTLEANLLGTGKYGRLWRRSICVGILISLKKIPCPSQDSSSYPPRASPSSPSAPSYVPLPSSPTSQKLRRSFSNLSYCSIDIHLDTNHDEETEVDPHDSHQHESQRLRDAVAQIVEDRDSRSLQKLGGVEGVVDFLGSNLETGTGINSDSVQDPESLITTNLVHFRGFLELFVQACCSYTNLLLLIAAGLSFGIEVMEQGSQTGWHDGVAILFAVFMLVTFPLVANFFRAKSLHKKWRKQRNKLRVHVVRDGRHQLIDSHDILVGDKVYLERGDRVPADGLFVNGTGLLLDELPNSEIEQNQNPFLFAGSKVKEGRGLMLVTSVDANSAFSEELSLVSRDPNEKALLGARIEKPHEYLDKLVLLVSVLIALAVIIRLSFKKQEEMDNILPELKGHVSVDFLLKLLWRTFLRPRGIISNLTSSIVALMVAFQHGIPFAFTLSLLFWKKKFNSGQAYPQNLSACGTMGIVTVLCVNATGKLILSSLEVSEFWIGERDMTDNSNFEPDQCVLEALCRGIGAPILVPETSVSSTNEPFIDWVKSRWNMNMEFPDRSFVVIEHGRSSSDSEGSGILMRKIGDNENILHLHWKGAASTILGMCSHYYDSSGELHVIEDQRRKFRQMVKDMEENGLRPFGFACGQSEVHEVREHGLHLLALVGLKYRVYEEFKIVVEAFRRAGVRIILLSEEDLSIVRAIAYDLGIPSALANDIALEVQEIDQRTVIGRCLYEEKRHLVQRLQQNGGVVAFFGRLTSRDVPALRQADVGITEMAWKSSDIVIECKDSLPLILKLSRCSYHNIQKFTQLQLITCFSWSLITLVATMTLGKSPMTGIQLIWVNFIMCGLGSLMMVMELESQELMTRQPADRTQSLVTEAMWKNIAIQVNYQAVFLLVFQFIPGIEEGVRNSIIFNSFTLCQFFNQLNVMGITKKEVLVIVLGRSWFLVAVGACMVVQVLLVEFAKGLADCEGLNALQWAFCFLFAATSWVFDFAVKFSTSSFST